MYRMGQGTLLIPHQRRCSQGDMLLCCQRCKMYCMRDHSQVHNYQNKYAQLIIQKGLSAKMDTKGFNKCILSIDYNHQICVEDLISHFDYLDHFNLEFVLVILAHRYYCFVDQDSRTGLCINFHYTLLKNYLDSKGHLENCLTCKLINIAFYFDNYC